MMVSSLKLHKFDFSLHFLCFSCLVWHKNQHGDVMWPNLTCSRSESFIGWIENFTSNERTCDKTPLNQLYKNTWISVLRSLKLSPQKQLDVHQALTLFHSKCLRNQRTKSVSGFSAQQNHRRTACPFMLCLSPKSTCICTSLSAGVTAERNRNQSSLVGQRSAHCWDLNDKHNDLDLDRPESMSMKKTLRFRSCIWIGCQSVEWCWMETLECSTCPYFLPPNFLWISWI